MCGLWYSRNKNTGYHRHRKTWAKYCIIDNIKNTMTDGEGKNSLTDNLTNKMWTFSTWSETFLFTHGPALSSRASSQLLVGICPQVSIWKWDSDWQPFPRMPSHHMPLLPAVAHQSYTRLVDSGFTQELQSSTQLKGVAAKRLGSQRHSVDLISDKKSLVLLI